VIDDLAETEVVDVVDSDAEIENEENTESASLVVAG
jgi:hypothetical protein